MDKIGRYREYLFFSMEKNQKKKKKKISRLKKKN